MTSAAKIRVVFAGYAAVAAVVLGTLWAPTAEAVGVLTATSDTVTNPAPGASTSHNFTFTTATTRTTKYIAFTFPTGFDVSAITLGASSGIGAGTLSNPSSLVACYTLNNPANVSAGTMISVQVNGVVNSGTTGSHSIDIATRATNASSCTAGGLVDTGTVTMMINNPASISAAAQKVFVFTVSSGALLLAVNPVSGPLTTASLDLTVATNTSSTSGGYMVTARTSQELTGSAYGSATIPHWTGIANTPTTWNVAQYPNFWAATRSGSVNDNNKYFGLTTTAQTIMTGVGPTNGDTTTVTLKLAVDYLTPADTYTTTIYYVGTPSF